MEILKPKKKNNRHAPEQIVKRFRDAEATLNSGKEATVVVHSKENREKTFYHGRNQFGGIKSSEAQRLKQLESEHQQLKEFVAKQQLGIKETETYLVVKRVSPDRKRAAANERQSKFSIFERSACLVIDHPRPSQRFPPKLTTNQHCGKTP